MIDIENAKNEFNEYVKKFNPEDGRIKLKIDHISRVTNYSKQIASNLNLNEEQIRLAELIGIFHDIGRFKQAEKYNTFSDKESGINHAEYSINVLYEDNLIEKFKVDSKYNHIIKKAVLNHNKSAIETGLSEEELLFAKIIRDADKLDIFYEGAKMFWTDEKQKEEISESKITDEVIELFSKNVYWNRENIQTKVDSIIHFISLIFDINLKYDFEVIKREDYINKILNKFDFKDITTAEQMRQIRKIANEYIESFLIEL